MGFPICIHYSSTMSIVRRIRSSCNPPGDDSYRVGNALACPPKTDLKLTKSPLLIVSGVGVYPSHLGSKYNRFNKMYASQQISFITLDPSSPQKEIWHQLTSCLSAVTVFSLLNFYPSAFPMLRPLRPPTQETRLRKLKKPSTVFPVNTPSCRRICLFFLWKNKTGF